MPKIVWERTTTNVLTMEYAPGVKINRVAELARLGVDRKLLARRAVEAYLQQLLTYGFFHAGARPPARAPRAGGPGSRSELCLVFRQARLPVGTESHCGRWCSLVFSAQIGQLWASPGFQWEGSCGWHAASFGNPFIDWGPSWHAFTGARAADPHPGNIAVDAEGGGRLIYYGALRRHCYVMLPRARAALRCAGGDLATLQARSMPSSTQCDERAHSVACLRCLRCPQRTGTVAPGSEWCTWCWSGWRG